MEVVAAAPGNGGVPPFHDHDVREWSRLDSLTGVLERARLETDHWTANTNLSSHKYGKVVDSRARTNADGALQQQARRQLEVFQSQVPGAQFQLIKTHTVSSSRWSNTITSNSNGHVEDFENLQLAVNPLDVSSQKSKASVGRSFGRRPPTRSRLHDDPSPHIPMSNPLRDTHLTAATNLHRVSRLCHQIHDTAVKQAFGRYNIRLPIHERQNGDGSVDIQEIESSVSSSNDTERTIVNGHSSLQRTKSTSSEDLYPSDIEKSKNKEDFDDLEQIQNWRRSSKVRRSLQFPKQNRSPPSKAIDLPENSVSVRKIREELEKGKRLTSALKTNVDLDSFDQILQTIQSSASSMQSDNTKDCSGEEPDQIYAKKEKRNSFVSVENLQEIKSRLRRTNSLSADAHRVNHQEDADDGLGSEENTLQTKDRNNISSTENSPTQVSKVRSYVFGMETMLNKKSYSGTGSLESKTKQLTSNTTNRNDDWYNRRKSYGFENVHNQEENRNSTLMQIKNNVESSTDSGICRSSEMFAVPNVTKTNISNDSCNGDINGNLESRFNNYEFSKNSKPISNVRKMTSLFNHGSSVFNKNAQDELNSVWNRVLTNRNEREENGINSTTITIPVGSRNATQPSWNNETGNDMKRHSIAVDESKYVTKTGENNYRRTSLAINSSSDNFDDDSNGNGKRNKRVEFCKTEVHFAPDSGKVNIVETDGKPPPTNNFRRRRRNSGSLGTFPDDFNGVSLLHFGDTSYEKSLLGINNKENLPDITCNNNTNNNEEVVYENLKPQNEAPSPIVTVNTNVAYLDYQEENKKDRENCENENRKGILKNKPIKPKPYHLGENGIPFSLSSDEDNRKWGVKLKPVVRSDPPIWKSTVTVQNTYFDRPQKDTDEVPQNNQVEKNPQEAEFQKLLKNLKPTSIRTSESFSDQDYRDHYSSMPETIPVRDNRRSSWSVADKNRVPPDTQWTENRGYSTKVNFGNGEATVVENRHPTWPRGEETYKEKKQILNKALVVRIGRGDSTSTHRVCSKTTTDEETKNTTTTTKITIDLSPSPGDIKEEEPIFKFANYQGSQSHSFKSTSLILDTIRSREESRTENKTEACRDKKSITKDKSKIKTAYDIDRFRNKDEFTTSANTTIRLQHNMNNDKNIESSNVDNEKTVPNQLESLKKLYEEVQSDSDADKEVQFLMSRGGEKSDLEDDKSSVVSGSWSKMRAYRTLNHFMASKTAKEKQENKRITLQIDEDEKLPSINPGDRYNERHSSPRTNSISENRATKRSDNSEHRFTFHPKSRLSPKVARKANLHDEKQMRTRLDHQPLSSPSLVSNNFDILRHEKPERLPRSPDREIAKHSPKRRQSPSKDFQTVNNSPKHRLSPSRDFRTVEDSFRSKLSPSKDFRTVTDQKCMNKNVISKQSKESETTNSKHSPSNRLSPSRDFRTVKDSKCVSSNIASRQTKESETTNAKHSPSNRLSPSRDFRTVSDTKCVSSNKVLRQPKESEMTYFGVSVSPRPAKKVSEAVIRKENRLSEKPDILQHHQSRAESKEKKSVKQSSRHISPVKKSESPIYENIKYKNRAREFDSAILEELTKAADQILQAVNGYTDDEMHSKFNTDDDEEPKKTPLATISETTGLKQAKKIKTKTARSQTQVKSRIKPTSSNSSIESMSRENTRVLSPTQKSGVTKSDTERISRRKTTSVDATGTKANTRARRLQRATSREALLQSHGSSSEDMTATVEVPLRKPRLVKKTKSAQLTMTCGPEIKKKETSLSERRKPEKTKQNDRVVGNLPEIRHKTAVSTIRSTAEKANRERSKERTSKTKTEDPKKRTPQKKEISRGSGPTPKHDRIKPVPSKEAQSLRTSTANIKKCHRAEGLLKY